MSTMQDMRCYLCDYCFVHGEEPWLLFNKRLQEDGQMYSSLAELIACIMDTLIEEENVHSSFLCDSCYADIVEYESLEQRFKAVRQRIIDSFNRNVTMNRVMKTNVNSSKVILYVNDDVVGGIDENIIIENGIDSDADLIEEVFDDGDEGFKRNTNAGNNNVSGNALGGEIVNGKVAIETDSDRDNLDFAAFNEHVAQNSLPPDILHLPDGYLTVAPSSVNISEVPLEYNDLIIYEGSVEDEIKQSDTSGFNTDTDDSQGLQSCKDFKENNSVNILNNISEPPTQDTKQKLDNSTNPDGTISNTNLEMVSKSVGELQDGKFVCLVCKVAEEYDYKSLLQHLLNCHNIKIYICNACKQGYSSSDGLKKHLNLEATCAACKCGICGETFETELLMRLHKRNHFLNAKAHECQVCHKKYTTKGMLEEHMNTHTGLRPFKCTKCKKDFASKYTLQSHMKIHTDRMRPHECDKCDKAFFNKQNLTQHMKLHVHNKKFVCEICAKPFMTQHSLTVHMIVHSGQKPFICRTCGKAFARRPEIKDHERTHTGERPFKCDLCPMAFAQRSNLTSHKKSTHFNEKLHRCTQCDRSFKRRRLLYYHVLAVHTGERPHKCNICGAGFVYPEHFKKHMMIHSGRKPYACEVCGKQFNSRDNRNAHRFVHSDKKPYECLECGAGFMRKPLLLSHMKKTKHVNDTIIVNQPQFVSQQLHNADTEVHIKVESDNCNNSNDNEFIEMIDNDSDNSNDFSQTNDNDFAQTDENVFVKSDEIVEMLNEADDIFTDIVNSIDHESDVNENEIINNNAHFLKPSICSDQFLKFENDYGGDHQSLIWSDIAG